MASADCTTISSNELFKTQINALIQMKIDLEKQKKKFIETQTKYHQQLSNYETKLEQLHLKAKKIQEEQDEKETNLVNATAEWVDIKTKLESSVMSPKQKVKLNVGGKHFETTIETLTKYNDGINSYFKALFSRQWQLEKDAKDDSIFIDRDGVLFDYILQYLRTGKIAIDLFSDLLRRDLMIEAQFYDLNILVNILNTNQSKTNDNTQSDPQADPKVFYSNTTILSLNDQKELNKLSGYDNQQWQLIYRASRDGYTAKAFHQCCDGCFPTMTVIRSKDGSIFGGFTSIPWGSTNEDKTDTLAFLFTLKNPHRIKPTKYSIHEQGVGFAVSHNPKEGPTFGSVRHGGFDLFLRSPFNTSGNRTFFLHSYQDNQKGSIYFHW